MIGSEEEVCGRDAQCFLFSDSLLVWTHRSLTFFCSLFIKVSPCGYFWPVYCEQKPNVPSSLKHLIITGRPSGSTFPLYGDEEAVCYRWFSYRLWEHQSAEPL